MADLFAHVLTGFILATAFSWRYEWLTPPLVTVAMVGATLPDLSRIDLVLPAETVSVLLGVPFSWSPLHRVGGTAAIIVIGVLLVPQRLRREVLAMLVLGAGSHYVLDLFLYTPSGFAGALFWPVSDVRLAVSGFYVSSDRWPAVLTTVVALTVWLADRQHELTGADDETINDTEA